MWQYIKGLFLTTTILGCAAIGERDPKETQFSSGLSIYQRECLACHMADGRGVPGINPGLIESPWIVGNSEVLIGYLLTGGFGPAVLMARFDFLTDAEMADVLSYCRAVFGRGASAVSAQEVAKVRLEEDSIF